MLTRRQLSEDRSGGRSESCWCPGRWMVQHSRPRHGRARVCAQALVGTPDTTLIPKYLMPPRRSPIRWPCPAVRRPDAGQSSARAEEAFDGRLASRGCGHGLQRRSKSCPAQVYPQRPCGGARSASGLQFQLSGSHDRGQVRGNAVRGQLDQRPEELRPRATTAAPAAGGPGRCTRPNPAGSVMADRYRTAGPRPPYTGPVPMVTHVPCGTHARQSGGCTEAARTGPRQPTSCRVCHGRCAVATTSRSSLRQVG